MRGNKEKALRPQGRQSHLCFSAKRGSGYPNLCGERKKELRAHFHPRKNRRVFAWYLHGRGKNAEKKGIDLHLLSSSWEKRRITPIPFPQRRRMGGEKKGRAFTR